MDSIYLYFDNITPEELYNELFNNGVEKDSQNNNDSYFDNMEPCKFYNKLLNNDIEKDAYTGFN